MNLENIATVIAVLIFTFPFIVVVILICLSIKQGKINKRRIERIDGFLDDHEKREDD